MLLTLLPPSNSLLGDSRALTELGQSWRQTSISCMRIFFTRYLTSSIFLPSIRLTVQLFVACVSISCYWACSRVCAIEKWRKESVHKKEQRKVIAWRALVRDQVCTWVRVEKLKCFRRREERERKESEKWSGKAEKSSRARVKWEMSMMARRTMLTVAVTFLAVSIDNMSGREFELGPCYLQFAETCSNNSIQFFLFSSELSGDAAPLRLDKRKPLLPLGHDGIAKSRVKLIIHGYGGHLDFNGSKHVRNGERVTTARRHWNSPTWNLHFSLTKKLCKSAQSWSNGSILLQHSPSTPHSRPRETRFPLQLKRLQFCQSAKKKLSSGLGKKRQQ